MNILEKKKKRKTKCQNSHQKNIMNKIERIPEYQQGSAGNIKKCINRNRSLNWHIDVLRKIFSMSHFHF